MNLKSYCKALLPLCGFMMVSMLFLYGKTIVTNLQTKLALVKKPDCTKQANSQTFKACDSLPFSEIKCGESIQKNETHKGKEYLVPDVVFFIWFGKDLKFHFFNYLAIRSIASLHQPSRIDFYYSKGLPIGKHWERTLRDIPCLNMKQIEEPQTVAGVKITDPVQSTDMARLQILLNEGGLYVDGDAITLKNLDPLRTHPVTIGRETQNTVCICVIMAMRKSMFLNEYYKYITTKVKVPENLYLGKLFVMYFTEFMKTQSLIKVYVEESSINRPNPWESTDGWDSTTVGHFDISDNYFLHIHTGYLRKRQTSIDPNWINWEEDVLRKLDTTYGEAARLALFGSSDLVFLPGEETHEMQPKRKIVEFPPIKQERAVLDDTQQLFQSP